MGLMSKLFSQEFLAFYKGNIHEKFKQLEVNSQCLLFHFFSLTSRGHHNSVNSLVFVFSQFLCIYKRIFFFFKKLHKMGLYYIHSFALDFCHDTVYHGRLSVLLLPWSF